MAEPRTITIFLIELRLDAGAVWLENEVLKLSVPKKFQNQETKDFISSNRTELVAVLKANNIFSAETFLKTIIYKNNISNHFLLSSAQERLWFIEQFEQGSNAYHIPRLFELSSATDTNAVKYAIQKVVERHEILRSTIDNIENGQHAIQVVRPDRIFIEERVFSDVVDCNERIKEDINRPFALNADYPLRVVLYYIPDADQTSPGSKTRTMLLINFHHIASDGWSEQIFFREFSAFYHAYINGDSDFSLPELSIQYKDYAAWQRAYLSGQLLLEQLDCWKTKLGGYQPLELHTDFKRPVEVDHKGADHIFTIDKALSNKLRKLSGRLGVSMHSIMLSGLNILLSKYTGQDDIVTGSPVANRHYRQTEELIGFFVNTLVNRSILKEDQSFADLAIQVHEEQVQAQRFQDIPFALLVSELGVSRDLSRHPIFQVMFSVVNTAGAASNSDPLTDLLSPINDSSKYQISKFDLSIVIDDGEDELKGIITYATSLFEHSRIAGFVRHFKTLLSHLVESPERSFQSFSLLEEEEFKQTVHDWNLTEVPYRKAVTIHEVFAEQAAKTPDQIALTYAGRHLTFRELDEKSNQLASFISDEFETRTNQKIAADTLIALFVERSLEMVVSIFAVLKAGAAYVPIDTNHPAERISYILDDTAAELILCKRNLAEGKLSQLPAAKIVYVDLVEECYTKPNADHPPKGSSNDLAYIIYTSGTTGRPNGVMISHTSVINYNDWMVSHPRFSECHVVDCSSSVSFDATVNVLLTPLCNGQQVCICDDDTKRDVNLFIEYLNRNRVELIKVTPSYMALLLNNVKAGWSFDTLKCVIVGGEKANKVVLDEFMALNPLVRILHHYGPTETTVGVTSFTDFEGNALLAKLESVPLGRISYNHRAYVLDRNLKPLPVGVVGELYVAGAGLARGYLNRPELTSERFLSNPFSPKNDDEEIYSGMYKTGDRVCWRSNGMLEYIGRNDDQVKISGYRIEPGEVESAMLQLPGVGRCAVLAFDRQGAGANGKFLAAYYVDDQGNKSLDVEQIRTGLAKLLPEYMIPALFIRMDSLPLTVNGKLDKRLLPDPVFDSVGEGYQEPVNDIEKLISSIWLEVLGASKTGVTDDFFRVGGDSILSIQVSGRIRQAGYICQVKDIFEHRTIRRLAKFLADTRIGYTVVSEQGNLSGSLGLLPIQRSFARNADTGVLAHPAHWNQSFLIRVPALETTKLSSVVRSLVAYHDVFRIQYTKLLGSAAGDWLQEYREEITIPELKTLDVSNLTAAELDGRLTDWQSTFDLMAGQLFQIGYLFGYPDGSARIYFAMHHMIVDGVTWRILADDVKTLYNGGTLPAKGTSYRQWVDAVGRYTNNHPEELGWWSAQLEGLDSVWQKYAAAEPEVCEISIDREVTSQLLYKAGSTYNTEVNDLLLTALAYALKSVNGYDDQGITLEGHGREDIEEGIDTSRTAGWFTVLYPVRLGVKDEVKATIEYNKELLRSIPNRGIGFGSFASENSGFTKADLPQVTFNYLGQFESSDHDWNLCGESSGQSIGSGNESKQMVVINGLVNDGEMKFRVTSKLGALVTQKLGAEFKDQLERITQHCLEQQAHRGRGYTPSDFRTLRISQGLLDRLCEQAAQKGNEISHIYGATSLQQGFIYHALSQAEDDAYRVQLLLDYHHALDPDKYIEALGCCISQYPILRTGFNWDEEIIQIIYKEGRVDCRLHDISHLKNQEDRDAAIDQIQEADRQEGFDLSRPTQLRMHIIRQAAEYYTVIRSEHHSIADGWSGAVLMTSLHEYYQRLKDGGRIQVQEDVTYLQAQEYIWKHKSTAHQYFNGVLAGVEGANDISALLHRGTDLSAYRKLSDPCSVTLEVNGSRYESLREFSRSEGITLNVIAQFVWHKVLQVYSGTTQTIVGTTISGRDLPIEGLEQSVGLYINTLPLVINWDNTETVIAQLHQIRDRITELNTHSYADLAKLQNNGERLFQSLFVYENYPAAKGSTDLSKVSFRKAVEKVDYPLVITVIETDALQIKLGYDGACMAEAVAEHLLQIFECIISEIVTYSGKPHHQLEILSSEETRKLLVEWNDTDRDYQINKTIAELFADQVSRTPDSIALVFGDQQFSYRELNDLSNSLASHIRDVFEQRTGTTLVAGELIALYMQRSAEMIVAVLAVLKAGGAYVPVDITYPKDRVDFMLADTKAEVVLTQRRLVTEGGASLPQDKVIYTDLDESFYSKGQRDNLPSYTNAEDLAYVIYTSGTTGRPKGVQITNRSVVNYIFNVSEVLLPEVRNIDFSTNLSFDLSVTTTICALVLGRTLFVYDGDLINTEDYIDHLCGNKIDFIKGTPSFLSSLDTTRFQGYKVKQAFIGGEKLGKNQLAQICCFVETPFDEYGPTEATVGATCISATGPDNGIGRPYYNYKVYVLDNWLNPVPVGVAGELYIGGAGVAKGYLNRPDLTKERFISNPFCTEADQLKGHIRLYKTGDRVCWRSDGNLEYLGRNDEQVKIRGYRIEPAEIEAAITQLPGITRCAVLAFDRQGAGGNGKYLVAYYVSDNETENTDVEEMRSGLAKVLPEYMIPAVFIRMDSLPLTANGKLDKRSLPDPDLNSNGGDYQEPVNDIEKLLVRIWSEVLGVSQIGAADDFFRIGGDSILSIQVSSRIRQAGYICQVKDIFEYRTIRMLAAYLAQTSSGHEVVSEQGSLSGSLGLLPIQRWFSRNADSGLLAHPSHWNQSFLIRVPALEITKLLSVVRSLVAYHDVFRIQYTKLKGSNAGDWLQEYREDITVPELKTQDVNNLIPEELDALLTEWQGDFDLMAGKLFQIGYLFGYPDGSARIYFAMHHMIVDGVTWRILADDVKTLYKGGTLPAKGSSYRQWVDAVGRYPKNHPDELSWWTGQLEGLNAVWEDFSETEQEVSDISIDREVTSQLLYQAGNAYSTEVNDLLLTALAYALQSVNGSGDQGITLEGHGREDIEEGIDTSHTAGWFTNMFPVRLGVKDDVKTTIEHNKELIRSIPNKGIGFGSFANENSGFTYTDLPPVIFNYLGQFDTSEHDWNLCGESSGLSSRSGNESRQLVVINGRVSDGELVFRIVTRLGAIVTQKLGGEFKHQIEQITHHCLNRIAEQGIGHTPSDFKTVSLSQALLDRLSEQAAREGNEISHIYGATSLQQGFIYHALSQAEDDAYRVQLLLDYHQPLDTDKYIEALGYCISQYPILRTGFNWDEEIIQIIYKDGRVDCRLHDISHLTRQEDRDAAIDQIQEADRQEGFDLSRPTQLRMHIIRQRADYYTVIKSEHHSIADGWSGPVLLTSLHEHYQRLKDGGRVQVQEDIAYLQAQEYIWKHKSAAHQYWSNLLAGVEGANDISALLRRGTDPSAYLRLSDPCTVTLEVSGSQYESLKAFSRAEGITLNVIAQFVWHKVLQVYSGAAQTIVGTTISGRDLPIAGIEQSVGLYINTLPLVINWGNKETVLSQLNQIRDRITELNTHSYADLAKLQHNGERLFQSLFVYENYPLPKGSTDLSKVSFRKAVEKVDYPLVITVIETQALVIKLGYDGVCMEEQEATRLLQIFERIISEIVKSSGKPHNQLEILSQAEAHKLLVEWNDTDRDYFCDTSLIDLFEDQVVRTPDSIALVFQERRLTYKELGKLVNCLAKHIIARYSREAEGQLAPDTLVALYLERSLETVVAILAVLKAGGAYVPLDVNYPQERIEYVLSDTGAAFILVNKSSADNVYANLPADKLIDINLSGELYRVEGGSDNACKINSDRLAYIIYTSGTTGRPKGVMIEHRSVVNLVTYLLQRYEINPGEAFLLFANYVFDASVEQMWLSLSSGGVLHIADNDVLSDNILFENYISENAVMHLESTPTFLAAIRPDKLGSLKRLLFGSEYLSKALFDEFKTWIPFVINEYGPTEATVTSVISINSHLLSKASIKNSRLYILDRHLCPVPIGVIGDLYIGGAGVARGYFNRPDLTAERFIENQFATAADVEHGFTRLYHTGDQVRWLPDGDMEFIGRSDDQVKIRGYRIEPAEIESALLKLPGIARCCVVALTRSGDNSGSKYLAAYYVTDESAGSQSRSEIREGLSKLLPEYMLPSAYMELKTLPLNVNGKLDRRALPSPEMGSENKDYQAPSTDIERQLTGIWSAVLGLNQVGITDDFFRIGGDSILSIQVSGRIRQAGYICQVKDIFEYRTIRRLAAFLAQTSSGPGVVSEQGNLNGRLGLLPIQKSFTWNADTGVLAHPSHWNQSFLIRVPELDPAKLSSVVGALVAYHDVFRIQYTKLPDAAAGHWLQEYREDITVPELKVQDVRNLDPEELDAHLTEWQSNFDLMAGRLFQIGYLFGYPDGSARIYFALHHMIVDGVTWRILADDVKTLYNGGSLPAKGTSYRQWVDAVGRYTTNHPDELSWWSGQLEGLDSLWQKYLVTDPEVSDISIDREVTARLLYQAGTAYSTEVNDLLLTALAYALQSVNGSDYQGITLEGHGREDIEEGIDTSHTAGWFTNMFPVRLGVRDDVKTTIEHNKELLRSIPNKGIGFCSFAGENSGFTIADLPPVTFNYLGQFGTSEHDWNLCRERSGQSSPRGNGSSELVVINGLVSDGELVFQITTKLGVAVTQKLAEEFKHQLEHITHHCLEQLKERGHGYTPSDFRTVRISQRLLDRLSSDAARQNDEISGIYAASSLQQGMIYHALSHPDDKAYHEQVVLDYHQPLDVQKYKQAFGYCIQKYPILRTAFSWEEEILQVIYKEGRVDCRIHDLSHIADADERNIQVEIIRQQDIAEGFDLSLPTLFRLHLICQSEDLYTLIKSEHHAISDGWSGALLFTRLHEYYQSLVDGKTVEVTEDDAYRRSQEYISSHKEAAQAYWASLLADVDETNDINPLLSRPIDAAKYRLVEESDSVTLDIVGPAYAKLKQFSRDEGITLNVIAQFAWHKLLQVYSSGKKTIVGTTISGRELPVDGIEESVGLYINTLPLVVSWENEESVLFQLHQIRDWITEMNSASYADLAKLQRNGERLFQSLFVYENYPAAKGDRDISKISFRKSVEKVDYPFLVIAFERGESLTLTLSYDAQYLDKSKAMHHLLTMERLIAGLVGASDEKHNRLSVLWPQEYSKIVNEWNITDADYPLEKSVCRLFEEQVAKTPDSIALVFEGRSLTYNQLNEYSNALARKIKHVYAEGTGKELVPDTLIALFMERCHEMVIAVLAVLKAGGAYVPIDTNYPQDRVDFLLQDADLMVIISTREVAGLKISLPADRVLFADLSEEFYLNEDTANLPAYNSAGDLAYVIYTSGTTGRPKGVMIDHRSLTNRVLYMISYSEIGQDDCYLFKTNYVFDVSVSDIFTHICAGARMHITRQLLDLDELSQLLISHDFTSVHLVPSQYTLVASLIKQTNITKIYFSGEAITGAIIADVDRKVRIFNYYGPTETGEITVFNPSVPEDASVIGKVFPNNKYYVLSGSGIPVPVGVAGELFIGGAGIARGYLNRSELTAERFIKNSFASPPDLANGYTQLYKTGDLVRLLDDGSLEYLGRNDDQVKIRGHRIELAEVEAAVLHLPGISQCCVLAKNKQSGSGNDRYLAAYFTIDGSVSTVSTDTIKEELLKRLPDYMVPAVFVQVDEFKLTTNGKLDKRALPDPDFNLLVDTYVSPANETEAAVCSLWQNVLGLDRVGVKDDFFKIGGNSISAIQVSHRMAGLLSRDIKVADIFRYKTISGIIYNGLGMELNEIPVIDSDRAALSFAQERLWFIEQFEDGTNAYHIPVLLELVNGAEIDGIKYAINLIVSRHEVLRSTIFHSDEQGHGLQVVHSDPLSIEEEEVSDLDLCKTIMSRDINRHFDLEHEYPLRVKFYRLAASVSGNNVASQRTFLLINFHHIAADGWSLNVFKRDLNALYTSYVTKDTDFKLPDLPVQYKDYAAWQRSYLSGDVLHDQISYWKKKLSGYHILELPTDFPRPLVQNFKGAGVDFELDSESCGYLRTLVRQHGVTLNSILLSAVSILLGRYSGQDDIVVGSPIANRHHRNTENIIGLFINTLVNRTMLNGDQVFTELIRQVHADQVQAQFFQDLPFERLVSELKVDRDAARHPVFQVMFSVNNNASEALLPDINSEYLVQFRFDEAHEIEKFDLSFAFDDRDTDIACRIGYSVSLFRKETIMKLAGHLQQLIRELAAVPEMPYSKCNILEPADYDQIVYRWNDTRWNFPSTKTVAQMFEHQALLTPGNIALIFDERKITYKELNEKSNQLARHIAAEFHRRSLRKLAPDTLVALCLERGAEMVISVLAILKAGGAFVPLDVNYPQERIDYVLNDSKAKLVLCNAAQLAEGDSIVLPESKIIDVSLSTDIYSSHDLTDLPPLNSAGDLAYVIYTSGTTGKPKGVEITQRSLVNFALNFIGLFGITDKSIVSQIISPAFDAINAELFPALLAGGALLIVPDNIRNDSGFVSFLEVNEVSHLTVPADLLGQMEWIDLPKLESINVGGGVPAMASLNNWSNGKRLFNTYGPTEITVCSNAHRYLAGDPNTNIGVPLKNVQLYVLDKSLLPVPVGVTGELFIGGAGVARGYLNLPELTSERFVPDPFASEVDKALGYSTLYKTGDMVRRLSNGDIEFVGRNDDQVKIRGYRIELGEVEFAMSRHNGIKNCCVLVKERITESGSAKYLVGYYVQEPDDNSVTEMSIRNFLSDLLPEYMIPSVFVKMDLFPLNHNGKLDKRLLPDPEFTADPTAYVAPMGDIEEKLCNIWQEALGVERVGTTDDFFQLGGNSILAIQLTHRMSRVLDKSVKVADLFRFKSIGKLLFELQSEPGDSFSIVKPFSSKYEPSMPDFIFIHPAGGGCEVYQEMAELLAPQFNCIGIDNFNFNNKNKIGSLSTLVNFYVTQFERSYSFKQPVNILGWSLGGQIALELAAVLELRGYRNINVVLLDTYLGVVDTSDDQKLNNEFDEYVSNLLKDEYKYGAEYSENIITSFKNDLQLAASPLSCHLTHSNVLLFKATQEKEKTDHKLSEFLPVASIDAKANNVDLFVDKLQVVKIDCMHTNILQTNVKNIVSTIQFNQSFLMPEKVH